MSTLASRLQADSIGLLATISDIAQRIGLPDHEQQIIAQLATGKSVTPLRND